MNIDFEEAEMNSGQGSGGRLNMDWYLSPLHKRVRTGVTRWRVKKSQLDAPSSPYFQKLFLDRLTYPF